MGFRTIHRILVPDYMFGYWGEEGEQRYRPLQRVVSMHRSKIYIPNLVNIETYQIVKNEDWHTQGSAGRVDQSNTE